MIALALALAAALAAPFQPPVDRTLAFTMIDDFAVSVHSRLIRHETLRFARAPRGYVATLVLTGQAVESPPAGRDALDRLLGPLVGVPTMLAIGADGAPGAPIDADAAWAAFLASRRALLAKIDGATGLAAAAPVARAAIAAETEPSRRDDRLREPFLALLPPALPALSPGAPRAFAGRIATPAGLLAAGGEITLVSTDAGALYYRIALRTAADVGRASAARLRAGLAADAAPETRARIERAAAALAETAFAETTDLTIARASGLPTRTHVVSETIAAGGARRVFATRDVTLDP